MTLNENIRFDEYLAQKIETNCLDCVDCFKLSAAQHLSGIFPGVPVYLIPQQQADPIMQTPPALFVQVYGIHREKRFNGEMEWELAVNTAYMSQDVNASSEQSDAAVKIMDAMENIPPVEGLEYPYTIYTTDSKTTDGIVNITGAVSVWERRRDDSPLIEFANTNVYVNRKDEA